MNKLQTMEDLRALRKNAEGELSARKTGDVQVIVGMGTCGIAAGARDVVTELLKELQRRHISNVNITKTGCIGMCEKEVLLDVVRPDEDRVTYGRVMPKDVSRIVGEHIVNGRIVEDLVVGRIVK